VLLVLVPAVPEPQRLRDWLFHTWDHLDHLHTSPMNLISSFRDLRWIKKIRKTCFYTRWRSCVFMPREAYVDDTATIAEGVEPVTITWPPELPKPKVGIVRDIGSSPRWTKYIRFLKANGFEYGIVDFHKSTWLESVKSYDLIVGFVSSSSYHLDEMRQKFYICERHLGIKCYPSYDEILIYEDKILETYLAAAYQFPIIPTIVTHDYDEAMQMRNFHLPFVSKIVPSSGSIGVELIRNPSQQRRLANQVFSPGGRLTHSRHLRQKNYAFFQQYIQSDSYDLRIIVISNHVFGYYRKAMDGDFRASGMGIVEKRALPHTAMIMAIGLYRKLGFSMLVVDFLRDSTGTFHIIELSPACQIDTPEQLHHEGVPGAYVFDANLEFQFVPGRFWVHELALKWFLEKTYLHASRETLHDAL
jgi:glutathione synthase/RimK-type ligase-like ATP-grasp enzyme